MIELNLDLAYLSNTYALSTQRINRYAKEDTDKMITLETEAGKVTLDASEFQSLMKDPTKVVKILQLMEPKNRYLIIRNLSQEDLGNLLPYLTTEQLTWGLQYFTDDKLGLLINKLPKEQIANLVFQHFSMMDILNFMPEEEMDKFFHNEHLDKKDVMKYFSGLDQSQFSNIMVKQFGNSMEKKNKGEYLQMLENMSSDNFTKFLTSMERKDKMFMISGLSEINPNYILEFNSESLSRPLLLMDKSKIIKTMNILDPKFILPMLDELPEDLIQVVATQIDPDVFAQILTDKFPDVISQMLAG